MSHTTQSKGKLLARVHRIQGQVQAIEKALRLDQDCTEVLQLLASTRGAMNGLMNEVVEGHIRHHVLSSKPTSAERKGAEELIAIVRAYFK
jgi:FrmR/RcnR family transcriptional regulator, repressor of frmRAB operon